MISKKRWIGRYLVAVAIGHTVVGLVVGAPQLMGIVMRGLFNTVSIHDPMTGMVVWFMLCGAALALLGMAVDELESAAHFACARALGVGTVSIALLGVILMPVSGIWLLLPASIGMLWRPNELTLS